MAKEKGKKAITMSDIVQAAKEAKQDVTKLADTIKRTIPHDASYSMVYTVNVHKKAEGVKDLIDVQTGAIKNLKDKCSTLNSKLRATKRAACLALALASVSSAFLGYSYANHKLNQEKLIIENSNYSNPYDYHKFFDNTNEFLKTALKDQLLRDRPDEEYTINHSIVESFNDSSEYGIVDVNMIYEPNVRNNSRYYTYGVKLSPELKKIYDTQLELQRLSLTTPEDEQNTIGFYKDVNALIKEQKNNLLDYKNKDNKSLEKKSKEILDDSSVSHDVER